MSFVPPHVNPNTVKWLLAAYKIERTYFSKEEDWKKESRKKSGGSHWQRYKDGWIEFADKQVAK